MSFSARIELRSTCLPNEGYGRIAFGTTPRYWLPSGLPTTCLRSGGNLSLPTLLRLSASEGDADRELGHDDESQRRIEAWLRTGPDSA